MYWYSEMKYTYRVWSNESKLIRAVGSSYAEVTPRPFIPPRTHDVNRVLPSNFHWSKIFLDFEPGTQDKDLTSKQ
jgi:hypothetical protein